MEINEIDSDYIKGKLQKHHLKQSELASMLEIDRTNISAWINGKRVMSQNVKSMFYYFFKFLEATQQEIIHKNKES